MRVLFALLVALAASPALAQQGAGTLVVRNRLYPADSRHEIQPGVGISINNKLTQHLELGLRYSYGLSESLAVELGGSWNLYNTGSGADYKGHTDVAKEVRDKNIVDRGSKGASDFSDLGVMAWSGFANLRWSPVYGKINLASELPVHLHWFLSGGAGAAHIHRESIAYCEQGAGGQCVQAKVDDGIRPAGNVSSGFLFYLGRRVALRAELRYVMFADQFLEGFNRDDNGQAVGGADADSPGLTAIPFINLGTSLLF